MPKITGGCLCGRIRYSGEAEPLRMVACHCKACQRYTGSAFLTVPSVPMKMRHRPTRSLALRARKDDLANAYARYSKNRSGGWRFQERKPQADGGDGGSLRIT